MGALGEVLLIDGWGRALTLETTQAELLDKFGTLPLPSEASTRAVHVNAIRAAFQKINQDWILFPCPANELSDTQPHPYQLHTPAKKFEELSSSPLGVGALAIICWVTNMSDGGKPQFSNPVVIILRPLLTSPPTSDAVGHNLSDIGLDYNQPAKPLGKS